MTQQSQDHHAFPQDLRRELAHHLADWSRRTGIALETWALPAEPVSGPVANAALACIMEALSNVERHSRARTVSIAVTMNQGGLRLTVSDDGRGFREAEDGRGMAIMRARMASVGGSCSIDGTPGAGTTVTGVIPHTRPPPRSLWSTCDDNPD
ncbi:sensor histidine kinase [Nonomuraea sp. NPDC050547]|uniref:sensor histidine kinase n=1 Tax=Nonomuraea sp. NPDC050547 TaxID=3364368 RepID=UPI003796859F